MATFDIKMPKLGESITEGTIESWYVNEGDTVQEDQNLFEVSSAKVSAEIPSPVAGKIKEIKAKVGDTVSVGAVVAVIEMEGEDNATEEKTAEPEPKQESAPKPAQATEEKKSTEQPEKKEPQPQSTVATQENKQNESAVSPNNQWYSPVIMQMIKEANLSEKELAGITGTGFKNRLTKSDLQKYLLNRQEQQTEASKETKAPKEEPANNKKEQATTAGSDVKEKTPSTPSNEGDEIIEMDRIRRIIADHMVMSKKVSPHVTSVVEADVTRLVEWRSKNKDEFKKREGIALTFMPAITEATAIALKEFPGVNASVDGYNIIRKKHINIGIAVSLDDGNLIVPVIHDADRLNLSGLALSIDELAKKARSNKLSPKDIDGGTFSITNFGSFKNLFGMPIINQPQVAILAVGYIQKKPAVVETPEGDTIAIRHKMYLSLSYDHRIVDGALGGSFLQRIAAYLENWDK